MAWRYEMITMSISSINRHQELVKKVLNVEDPVRCRQSRSERRRYRRHRRFCGTIKKLKNFSSKKEPWGLEVDLKVLATFSADFISRYLRKLIV